MSREIKFRAWDNVKNKMYFSGIEDEVVLSFDSSGLLATDLTEHDWGFKKLEHLKYMQYTSLKDKNGKEIYEGDILKCKRTKVMYKNEFDWDGGIEVFFKNSVIEWWESFSNIGYRLRDGKGKTMMVKPSSLSKMEVEIIGNIYENHELLEQSS